MRTFFDIEGYQCSEVSLNWKLFKKIIIGDWFFKSKLRIVPPPKKTTDSGLKCN